MILNERIDVDRGETSVAINKVQKTEGNKKEKEGDKTTYFLSRGASNPIFLCVAGQRTIGIS